MVIEVVGGRGSQGYRAARTSPLDQECIRTLSRQERNTLIKAINEYLERRDHGGTISCDDFSRS
jgi:hypothetical protein